MSARDTSPSFRTTTTTSPKRRNAAHPSTMPSPSCCNTSAADLSLNIVVVGGNIAGLATAYALKKAGHKVLILEKSNGMARCPGSVRSTPNMTKILDRWGLGPALVKCAHKCEKIVFRTGKTGDLVAAMILNEEFMHDIAADFFLLQHHDLYTMLYELAQEVGVEFRFECSVTSVDSTSVSVTVESGERLFCDVIVGADGYKSIVRPIVTGELNNPQASNSDSGELNLSFIVPASKMKQHEDLRPFANMKMGDWTSWMGDGYILHGGFSGEGRDFTATMVYKFHNNSIYRAKGHENDQSPLARYSIDLQKFEPKTRKLLSLGQLVFSRVYRPDTGPENVVCEESRVTLVGDAAHPLMPVGNINAATGIEDAQTLGCLFSRLKTRSQISQLLNAYEDIRQPRSRFVQDADRGQHDLLSLPSGPMQEQRNAILRSAMVDEEKGGHMDEVIFREVWGKEIAIYSYDATEQVDDWWTKWGSMLVRGSTNGASHSTNVEVSISRAGW
ncbi:hypothetical protein BDQ12DRAFT_685787 [Crucibulum laeve]|uniref:FAD-binding domain-containing protein n=1 Tax=Crucibulum laeve TaxID=68775 RepID=A0A5C3LVS2_9AGAR|nr:hypothetical protein BDQ12DRAFT_685787 [Crucibulum laeve]